MLSRQISNPIVPPHVRHSPIFEYPPDIDNVAQKTVPRDIKFKRRERPKTAEEAKLKTSNMIPQFSSRICFNLNSVSIFLRNQDISFMGYQ